MELEENRDFSEFLFSVSETLAKVTFDFGFFVILLWLFSSLRFRLPDFVFGFLSALEALYAS